jgi:CheY-like chemotaxis protein
MRVLVVDDDPDTREVLALSLTSGHGWDVQAVGSGAEALDLCRSRDLDAVLLDVDLPVMDGPGVLAALRADPRTAQLPIVFVTALAHPVLNARLCALGAVAVLAKPFDALRIGYQIAELLGW